MYNHVKEIFSPQNYEPFLSEIFKELDEYGVNISSFELDHICYRVDNLRAYETTKNALYKEHDLIHESIINGRPISIFALATPIKFQDRTFEILELPAPKENSKYTNAFEHVEFVIDESLEEFMNRHRDLSFDLSGFTKVLNRDIRLHLRAGSVKFHEMSLIDIIKMEQQDN